MGPAPPVPGICLSHTGRPWSSAADKPVPSAGAGHLLGDQKPVSPAWTSWGTPLTVEVPGVRHGRRHEKGKRPAAIGSPGLHCRSGDLVCRPGEPIAAGRFPFSRRRPATCVPRTGDLCGQWGAPRRPSRTGRLLVAKQMSGARSWHRLVQPPTTTGAQCGCGRYLEPPGRALTGAARREVDGKERRSGA